MYCPEQLTCWTKVVPVHWTKHDVTKKCRGLGLISPFSDFLFPGRWACGVNFYKAKKERAGKTENVAMLFLKHPLYKVVMKR